MAWKGVFRGIGSAVVALCIAAISIAGQSPRVLTLSIADLRSIPVSHVSFPKGFTIVLEGEIPEAADKASIELDGATVLISRGPLFRFSMAPFPAGKARVLSLELPGSHVLLKKTVTFDGEKLISLAADDLQFSTPVKLDIFTNTAAVKWIYLGSPLKAYDVSKYSFEIDRDSLQPAASSTVAWLCTSSDKCEVSPLSVEDSVRKLIPKPAPVQPRRPPEVTPNFLRAELQRTQRAINQLNAKAAEINKKLDVMKNVQQPDASFQAEIDRLSTALGRINDALEKIAVLDSSIVSDYPYASVIATVKVQREQEVEAARDACVDFKGGKPLQTDHGVETYDSDPAYLQVLQAILNQAEQREQDDLDRLSRLKDRFEQERMTSRDALTEADREGLFYFQVDQ